MCGNNLWFLGKHIFIFIFEYPITNIKRMAPLFFDLEKGFAANRNDNIYFYLIKN